MNAITALKALEQPAQQEPVAWLVVSKYSGGKRLDVEWNIDADAMACSLGRLPLYTSPQPAQQEPVAIALNTGTKQGVKWLRNVEHGKNLYTTPQAPVQQEPVSVEHCVWARNGNSPCPHTTPQPAQQEPVNQRAHEMALRQWDHWKHYALELQEKLVKYEGGSPMVLNTSPPAQRTWVGLTLKDREALRDQFEGWNYPAILVDVISDMLRERNQ